MKKLKNIGFKELRSYPLVEFHYGEGKSITANPNELEELIREIVRKELKKGEQPG